MQVNDLLLPLVGDTDASMETSALAALALGLVHVASAQEDAVEAILQVSQFFPGSSRINEYKLLDWIFYITITSKCQKIE